MARKRGMQYIPYDYEAAYNKAMEDMHEWFIENLFQHRKKVIYALKEMQSLRSSCGWLSICSFGKSLSI